MVMCGHKLASNYKAGLQFTSVFNNTVWDSCLCLAGGPVQPNRCHTRQGKEKNDFHSKLPEIWTKKNQICPDFNRKH